MGLFWSLEPGPGQKEGVRLLKRDVTTPFRILVSVIDNHIEANTQQHHEGENVLARVTLERTYMDSGVSRITVRQGKIRGALFLPPGDAIYMRYTRQKIYKFIFQRCVKVFTSYFPPFLFLNWLVCVCG